MPFGNEPVGGQSRVQRTIGDAVEIRDVTAADGAETIEIEMGIAQFEGIEGPFNERDAVREGVLALKKFQLAADAAILIRGIDGGHVGVKKNIFPVTAGDGHGEANQAAG